MNTSRRIARIVVSACAVALVLPAAAPAAQDTFLKLDGIKGESLDDKHKDEIDVLSFSWGLAVNNKSKPKFQDFAFTKRVDASSPVLFTTAASGKAIPHALLTIRTAGERPAEYLTYCMTDVRVTGITTSSGDERPDEQVTLSFSTFFESYKPQKADGTLGIPIVGGWDLLANALLSTSTC